MNNPDLEAVENLDEPAAHGGIGWVVWDRLSPRVSTWIPVMP